MRLLVVLKEALDDQNRDQVFKDLAYQQRAAPETAMLKIQRAGIAQLYDTVAEHVGDLIHRMSEDPRFFKGGYGAVKEKVDKMLYRLTYPYGFEKEFHEQIHANLQFNQEKDEWMNETYESLLRKLKELGKNYADEHRKLPVYNEAQKHANEAAISVGEFRFDDTIRHLKELDKHLDKGREHWEKYALEYSGRPLS